MGYLEKAFLETVKFRELLPEGSRILAAVSGGGDSVALLQLILSFRDYMGWDVAVLHIDHRVREESGADAAFVKDMARSLGVGFICRTLESPAGGSLESYFSIERQRIYEEVSEGNGLVATGHTADDRAETLVMRLMEGSGLRGLGGMDYSGRGPVRRPLLDFSRLQLRRYLESSGIKWLEDPTNSSDRFLRNRIRHEVIPAFEAVSPDSIAAIARSSANLAMWRDLADDLIRHSLDGLMQGSTFLREVYLNNHPAIRMGILWTICGRPRGGRLEFEKTDKWLQVTDGGYHDLPGGVRFVVEDSRVSVMETPSERERSTFEGT
ncbi:MAG: tRNA lysidine(34) synthetase TilS [Candidatus Aegiribacteria sp.]|nr:tRNA lysidine(34) synthetase TilS [Candidatus Aegiribacteria sp.]MBD3294174.1 tRNA lysidine(34) synthetase TilS [Candidatus Fermentibacteria bacterium]